MGLIKCGNVMELEGENWTLRDALNRCEILDHWLAICNPNFKDFEEPSIQIYLKTAPDFIRKQLYSKQMLDKKIRLATMGVVDFIIFKDN